VPWWYILEAVNRKRGHPRSKLPDYSGYQLSPFASTRMEGPRSAVSLFAICFDLIRTAFHPDRTESLSWYDRTIRILGGVLILAAFAVGLILLVLEAVKK